jgi:type I restriction enzyme S subunit
MEKAYETYKDSRYEWFRNIPSEWQIISFKYLVNKIYTGGTPTTSNSNYWVDKGQGIPWVAISDITKSNKFLLDTKKEISEDGRASKGLDILPKDTLLLSIFASLGKTVRLGVEATVNQAILGLETNEKLSVDFLEYLFVDAERYISYYSSMSTQENLNLSKIRSLNFPIPPKKEQTQIATYLDYHTQLIDTLISKKETLIQKLQEQRQAIINEAVTKGLNKDVALKDSGIEWLGEIPETWEVIKLRYLADITTGDKDTENREDDGEFPFFVRSQTIERISSYSYDGEAILTAGDGVGVCKVWHYINGKFDFHQRVYMMHNFRKVTGTYLFNFMKENFIYEVLKLSAKSTVDSLRRPMFLDFPVAVPPLDEQNSIIHFLSSKQVQIDNSLEGITSSIQKLKDYRQSLISEAVTGKIDVRDWQRPIN